MSSEQLDTHSVHTVPEKRESRTPTIYDGPEETAGDKVADGGKDPYLVDSFDDGDKLNPLNWSMARRWYLTFLGGMLVLNA